MAAFAAGGTDYVTKPIRAREVIARIVTHTHAAREQAQARNALDAFGHATLVVRLAAGRLVDVAAGQALDVPLIWHAWDIQTPLTRTLSDAVIATARKWLLQDGQSKPDVTL